MLLVDRLFISSFLPAIEIIDIRFVSISICDWISKSKIVVLWCLWWVTWSYVFRKWRILINMSQLQQYCVFLIRSSTPRERYKDRAPTDLVYQSDPTITYPSCLGQKRTMVRTEIFFRCPYLQNGSLMLKTGLSSKSWTQEALYILLGILVVL